MLPTLQTKATFEKEALIFNFILFHIISRFTFCCHLSDSRVGLVSARRKFRIPTLGSRAAR